MSKRITIDAKNEKIPQAVQFIEVELLQSGYQKKDIVRQLLLSEEMLVQLCQHTSEDKRITVEISGFRKKKNITIKAPGERFELSSDPAMSLVDIGDVESSEEQTSIISKLILKSYADAFCLVNRNGCNNVTIKVREEKSSKNLTVFSGMLMGLLLGLIIRLVFPQALQDIISNKVCSFVSYLFMNGIGLVVAPLVFFSVADSISGFSDMKSFGKLGAKVMGFYLMTSLFAIFISYPVQRILSPGNITMLPSVEAMYSEAGSCQTDVTISLSILDAMKNMIPSNIVASFLSADMIQIILIAVLVGVASGSIGEYSEPVQTFLKSGNALFSKIITYIVGILPIVVLCMMANMVITIDFSQIGNVAIIIGTVIAGLACMLLFYAFLIAVFCRMNPLMFFKNQREAMALGFSSCSSAAVMPVNMKCLDRFGVSPKVYSFSIPLGATINMDGVVVYYVVTIFTMMRIYGVELDAGSLVTLMMTIFFLAIGTPCVAGSGIAAMTILITQVGIPVEAMAFIIPILTILDFFITMVNITGDAACSVVVAKTEGLLTRE